MKIPELIEKNKYLFAAYSAMALMNIRTVFNHIQNITDISGDSLDDSNENYWEHPVMTCLEKNTKILEPEKIQMVIEKLFYSFPFLNIMAENQRIYLNNKNAEKRVEINSGDIHYVLNILLRVVKGYRDYTSHYVIKNDLFKDDSPFLSKSEQPLAIVLNKYYDIALRNVKERYNYSTLQLAFIQSNRYKNTYGDGKRRTISNLDFPLSLISKNGCSGSANHISAVGAILMICLFLEKKYIYNFVQQTQILRDYPEQSDEHCIVLRSMGINSVRLPKERIRSEKKVWL